MFLLRLAISYFCLLPLNLLVSAAPPIRACFDDWMNSLGYTTPRGDIILKVGSSLEIYCTLNTSNPLTEGYTADDIIFDKGTVTIDQKYVTVINKTTARLYMENLPITKEEKFHYCYAVKRNSANASSLSSESAKKIVCMNHVEIGVKPQNVSNFSCVSHKWETLYCTWKEPNNGIITVYSLFYSIPGSTNTTNWHRCPEGEQNACKWTFHTVPPYIRNVEYINFRMDASNPFGNSTQTFEFNHYAHVIPAPARKLTFLGTTPHSIYIEWSIGIFKNFKKGLAYRVSYAWYLANDWNEEEGKFNSEDAIMSQILCRNLTTHPCWNVRHYSSKDVEIHGDTVGVNVTNLKYPNAVYDFRIEMKSAIASDELWSDPAYMYAKTDPCAPYLSPEIDVGGFQIDNRRLDRQDVQVFWKDIPPEEQNGNEFQYKITMLENDVESTTAPDLVTNSFAKYVNLSIHESYRFFIKSTNAFGSAPYSAELRLPQKDDILPEVVSLTKVYFENGTYELSWSPQNSIYDKITNFTIFWCQSSQEYPSPCSGSLDWTHLTANTCRQNFTLDPTVGYHFAISANSLNSTSGMTWALCTIVHDKLQKIKPVWVTTVGSYFIHLQWKLECLERAVDIKGFNITYCPVDEIDLKQCAQPTETLLVYGDAKTEQANVTDLNPFTHYKIAVSIFTNNSLGPPSDDVSTRTLEAAPNMVDVQVEIFDITNSSAAIQWNTPTTLNGLLNRYEVFYNNEKIITNNTIATLLGLSSYKTYEIRIAACTNLCSRTAPMNFQTSIGTPGEVTKIWVENTTNSTHIKLKWNPPEVLGGPHPIYDVHTQIMQLHQNLTIDEFETTGTEADVKISCELESSHSHYTFFVRAKNIDHFDTAEVNQYFGPWSMAYSIDCINHSSMQTIWKVLIGSLFGILLLLLVPFLCKKAYLKFHQMKQVQVILPIAFHLDVRIEVKHTDCCDDDGKSWKDDNEIDLVSKDTDLDQHSIDEVDFKLLSDKEKAKESKEKCSLS